MIQNQLVLLRLFLTSNEEYDLDQTEQMQQQQQSDFYNDSKPISTTTTVFNKQPRIPTSTTEI